MKNLMPKFFRPSVWQANVCTCILHMPIKDARHIGLVFVFFFFFFFFFSFHPLVAKTGPSNLGILDKSIWLICHVLLTLSANALGILLICYGLYCYSGRFGQRPLGSFMNNHVINSYGNRFLSGSGPKKKGYYQK